jgi:acetyl-CoA synthetase
MSNRDDSFQVTLKEDRKFEPPAGFVETAEIQKAEYQKQVALGKSQNEKYWEEAALDLRWATKWNKVLEWKAPEAQWFVGGRLNASVNCLDRHLEHQATKAALIWEGEPGELCATAFAGRAIHRRSSQGGLKAG